MKFKVDENLPVEVAHLLTDAGHDAITIYDEKLGGADDDEISPVFQKEKRAFVPSMWVSQIPVLILLPITPAWSCSA